MNFDPNKPHGVITNHSWAKYEQNGILYDSLGQPMDQIAEVEIETDFEPPVAPPPKDRTFDLNQARDFLANILADGPLARSVIFKECNANNQNWEAVKTAFADMGGEALKRKNVIHWKLKPN
jgi:hypothetical protein